MNDDTTPELDEQGPGEPVAPVAEPEAPEPDEIVDEADEAAAEDEQVQEEADEDESPSTSKFGSEPWLPGSGSHVFSEATADQFPDDPRL